jgi:uncharacterized protein (DUF2147 family)
MLMVLTSSASSARADSHSFVIGGHRIHVEARHGCRSLSCVSWSDSASRNRRDRDDDATPAKPTTPQAPNPAPAAVQPQPAPSVAPAPLAVAPVTRVAAETIAPPPAVPRAIELASTTTQSVPPPVPMPESRIVEKPRVAPPPVPAKARDDETAADTPLGDWQTEGRKGLVRIEQCGKSLCGYVLNEQSDAKGETVLSNMKSKNDNKNDRKWAGEIFSRASGNSYYAKLTQKAPNTLHVEACALLRFFCSGNDWTRVVKRPEEMVIARPSTGAPSS